MTARLELLAIEGIPLLREPAPLGPLVVASLEAQGFEPRAGDVFVVAHKLVSKAEGRVVALATVTPGAEARALAQRTGKDPRLVEVILRESRAVVKAVGPHLIMEHRLGFVCANAAVDRSNTGESDAAVLLPLDPDRSADELRSAIERRWGAPVGVIVSDSHGRAFRIGAIGVALGVAGIAAIDSWRGRSDLDGRVLETSEEAVADELASAASLLMGQGAGARPLVVVRGHLSSTRDGSGRDLVRPEGQDLFR